MTVDVNTILQAVLIASILGSAKLVISRMGRIEDKLDHLSERQARTETRVEGAQKELSHHNRRLEHMERTA